MTLQRIIAIAGSAVLATALMAEARAQADGDQPSPEGMKTLESTIYFDFDSAALDQRAKQKLDPVVAWLQENPKRVVVVAGHTDEVGQENYNLVLGKERARQTKQYLVSQGIAPERIIAVSFGEEYPVAKQATKNRRTVFYATRTQQMGQVQGRDQQQADAYGKQQADAYGKQQADAYGKQQADAYGQQQGTQDDDAELLGMEPRKQAPEGFLGTKGKPAEELVTPYGLSVSAGGGVMGFLSGDMRGYTSPGGTWDLRVTFGTRMRVAAEAMYFGSLQDVDAVGLDDDALLLGTGFESNLRAEVLRMGKLQPYVLGGLGWTHYSLVGAETNVSVVEDSDDILHIPLGVGVGARVGSFLVDLRGTVRIAFLDDMVRTEPEEPEVRADMSTWGITARVGLEF